MKSLLQSGKLLKLAAGFLLFSILLMIITIPIIRSSTSANVDPKNVSIGISIALGVHLLLFFGFLKVIRDNRNSNENKKVEYIGLGILLLIFGLIIMDGAIEFLGHKDTLLFSILMFISVLGDIVASIIAFVIYFLKPQKVS